MKLWIDDIRDAPDESWVEVRKVQPAIAMIANFAMEEISLDHDIENRPDDETFLPVAYFIALRYHGLQEMSDFQTGFGPNKKAVPTITIHSVNPVGAKEMQDIMADYGIKSTYKPYSK